MMDSTDDLRTKLVHVHQTLASAEQVAEEDRALLTQLLEDIERLLAKGASKGAHAAARNASVVSRLGEAARNFEETHPNLSGAVGSVIDALSRMGI